MNTKFKNLLSPFKIGDLKIKNRLTVAPMGDGYLTLCGARGEYSLQGIEHAVSRARGGFGLLIQGCVLYPDNKVDSIDPISSVLDNKDIFIKQGLLMNERVSYYDMKIFQQLTLGLGRNWGHYSCSANPSFDDPGLITNVLTQDQIKQKVDCVIECAELMKNAGFAGVEIHALHWGYLLDQFAMSITNHREDEYGGCLENRMRVCNEIITGIKQTCGQDFPVSMRLGLKSYIKGFNRPSLTGEEEAGRTLEEGIRISKLLEQYGYDVLNVDVGMYDSFYHACPPVYMPQGHVIPLAYEVKKAVDIPVICGSRMSNPYISEAAIEQGKIDAVAIGRASLAEPHYVKKLEAGTPHRIRPCISCNIGCMGKSREGAPMTCSVNPQLYKEYEFAPHIVSRSQKVIVAGGGIAGMEAARSTKLRGFDVTIYEKSNQLGGTLRTVRTQKLENERYQLADWYINEIHELSIPVVYNMELNPDNIKELNPDIAILAIGAKPVLPPITDNSDFRLVTLPEALESPDDMGNRIVIAGGNVAGCEAAIDYAMMGKEVILIEPDSSLLTGEPMVPIMTSQMLPDLLNYYKVNVMTGYKLTSVNNTGAVVTSVHTDQMLEINADKVVVSAGMEPLPFVEDKLYGSGIEVFKVGDCSKPGNIYTAIHSAYEIANSL